MNNFLEKTYWIWLIVGFLFIFYSIQRCNNAHSDFPTEKGVGFNTIVIDSCEYLIGGSSYQGYMAHKGNCKYCKERNGK